MCYEDKNGWEVEGAVNFWLISYGNIKALYGGEFCWATEGLTVTRILLQS